MQRPSFFITAKTLVCIAALRASIFNSRAMLFQQTYSSDEVAAQNPTLNLELSSVQNSYLLLEPIPFNFNLSNKNTVPIKWNGLPALGHDLSLLTRAENGGEFRCCARADFADIIPDTEVMQPSENKRTSSLIGDFVAERLFPRAGRYELQVEFKYLDFSFGYRLEQKILSNPITIEIREPSGNDRRAYDYLKNTYQPVRRGGNAEEKTRMQQYFVHNFRDTVYWKYITFELAEQYAFQNEHAKAEQEYFKLIDLDFYYSKKVKSELARLAVKLGRPTPLSKHPLGAPLTVLPPDAPTLRPIPPIKAVVNPTPSGPPPVLIPIPNPKP